MNLSDLFSSLSGNQPQGITPEQYQQMLVVAQELDRQSGTTTFTQTLQQDPEGFAKNIMTKVGNY